MTTIADYSNLLASKAPAVTPSGHDRFTPSDALFDFQNDLTRWTVRKGRAAVWADCGLGKTRIALHWAETAAQRTLILTPLAVAPQFVEEGRLMGVDVTHARYPSQLSDGINVTNYDRLHLFDTEDFGAVVLDECFVGLTKVDTPSGWKYIKDLQAGDTVVNVSGTDTVVGATRRKVSRVAKVKLEGAHHYCSLHHPWLTHRGWVAAQDLRAGDHLVATAEAMRLVREGVRAQVHGDEGAALLRNVLLGELAHEPTRTQGQSSQRGRRQATRGCAGEVLRGERTKGEEDEGASRPAVSDERSEVPGEVVGDPSREGPQAERCRRERPRHDGPTAEAARGSERMLDGGVCRLARQTSQRIPNALQAGSSKCCTEERDRVRRAHAQEPRLARSEEGCEAGRARVDGVEVLELGHPELDRFRDAGGSLYLYDIECAQHPSFSVGGVLVHNSSCLKDYTSKTRNALIDRFADTPWRLACSATPAPNDTMELGNHAEFLGTMSRSEMLASFFVHDGGETQKWRLKGHAIDEFWSWMSSWAIALRSPSDLGYPDDGYGLPPLRMHQVEVEADASIAREAGLLFVQEARGLASQREARRGSLEARCEAAAAIVNKTTGSFLIWCDLNAESSALAERIPDAVEIRGSDKAEHKEDAMLAFRRGDVRVLVTKPSIAGWGVNWQHCSQVAFVGLSNSFEQYYQAIRRTWRFGQTRPVDCYIVTSTAETGVLANLRRKQELARKMGDRMVEHMADALADAKTGQHRIRDTYDARTTMEVPAWM